MPDSCERAFEAPEPPLHDCTRRLLYLAIRPAHGAGVRGASTTKEKDMPRPIIDPEECSGCGICVDACPEGVLELVDEVAEPVNEDDCTGCATCMEECPMGAITEIEED